MNAEMALRRADGPACRPAMATKGTANVFMTVTVPRDTAINVVFTRIVNDYSTVHGTTAVCLIRGELHEPVNLGS